MKEKANRSQDLVDLERLRKRNPKKTAVTLIELMVVVVIVGLTMSFAVPSYLNSVEKAKNKEAINMIRMLWSAGTSYKMRESTGASCNAAGTCQGNAECNSVFSLSLPTNSCIWNYSGIWSGGVQTFRAVRNGAASSARQWDMTTTLPKTCQCSDLSGNPSKFCDDPFVLAQ